MRTDERADCAAVIVTHFPDREALDSLDRVASRCARLVVVDNTPAGDAPEFRAASRITVLRPGRNIGLAAALNRGVRAAGEAGFENIFLLDQDSRLPEGFFREMLNFEEAEEAKDSALGFCVADFRDRNSGTPARFSLLRRSSFRLQTGREIGRRPAPGALVAITSGTLIRYSLYQRIGPFREDYFIGFVDVEYGLRAAGLGLRVALNSQLTIDHAVGHRVVKRFLGLTLKPDHEPPARKYYAARNGVRTALDYFSSRPILLPWVAGALAVNLFATLLYEERKAAKVGATLAGVFDGLTGRMGERTGSRAAL